MIFLFLELEIFLFEFKDLILGGAGDAVDVCRRFQTRATPVSSRGSSGVAIGTWSFLSCRLLVQHWPHPHTRPSLIVSSPRFLPPPARRAVRMQGISEHQTHSTHDASRCPVSEDCHLFSIDFLFVCLIPNKIILFVLFQVFPDDVSWKSPRSIVVSPLHS